MRCVRRLRGPKPTTPEGPRKSAQERTRPGQACLRLSLGRGLDFSYRKATWPKLAPDPQSGPSIRRGGVEGAGFHSEENFSRALDAALRQLRIQQTISGLARHGPVWK